MMDSSDRYIANIDGECHLFINEQQFVIFDGDVLKMYNFPKLTASKIFKHPAFVCTNEIKPIYIKKLNAILFETYKKVYLFKLSKYKIIKIHSGSYDLLNFGISENSELLWVLDGLIYLYKLNNGRYRNFYKINPGFIIEPKNEQEKIAAIDYFNNKIQGVDSSDSEENKYEYNCNPFDFNQHAGVLIDANEDLRNISVTNSGKIIFFKMNCIGEKILCIHNPGSENIIGKSIIEFGEITFNENSHTIFVEGDGFLCMDDEELNEMQYILDAVLIDNYTCVIDYKNKILEIKHLDWSNIIAVDISVCCKKDKRTIKKIFIVGDIIYVYIRDHIVLYNINGDYIGNKFTYKMKPLHISNDNKFLLMKSKNTFINFDMSHIKIKEQKIAMVIASQEFTSNGLFDRNLLPVIFDFLPKLDAVI